MDDETLAVETVKTEGKHGTSEGVMFIIESGTTGALEVDTTIVDVVEELTTREVKLFTLV